MRRRMKQSRPPSRPQNYRTSARLMVFGDCAQPAEVWEGCFITGIRPFTPRRSAGIARRSFRRTCEYRSAGVRAGERRQEQVLKMREVFFREALKRANDRFQRRGDHSVQDRTTVEIRQSGKTRHGCAVRILISLAVCAYKNSILFLIDSLENRCNTFKILPNVSPIGRCFETIIPQCSLSCSEYSLCNKTKSFVLKLNKHLRCSTA